MGNKNIQVKDCTIRRVDSDQALQEHLPALITLLQSCVNDDPAQSSLGFLAPLSAKEATEYWTSISGSISGHTAQTALLVALADGIVLGTGQVARIQKATQSYRGEVRKVLVSSESRGFGLGRKMMAELERVAHEDMDLDILMLDTSTETPARGFYQKLGWTEWGTCPDYSFSADGVQKHSATFFFKRLTG
ncbi:acetyltransferase (GNAT) family protein [Sarocladium implicatum]|jgi:GNAT superfamily N-acetyltransferase|nr:acetyltransferase (GNAT) family protein [Sarocladium implicatum]